MQKEKEIQSLTITAGSRTYFIDVRETTENKKYLSISESRRMQEGYFEKHKVLVFEEDVHKFVAALQATLTHFTAPEKSRTEAIREKFPNAFKPWTQEADAQLERLYDEGRQPAELSAVFQRNPGAIHERIEKLGLKLKHP